MHIVKYSAEWCQPCKQLSAMLALANHGVEIIEKDVDVEQEAAMKDNVRGVPTMIAFDGEKELGRKIGSMSKDQFLEWLNVMKGQANA